MEKMYTLDKFYHWDISILLLTNIILMDDPEYKNTE